MGEGRWGISVTGRVSWPKPGLVLNGIREVPAASHVLLYLYVLGADSGPWFACVWVWTESLQSCLTLCDPVDHSLCPWDSPGKNPEVGLPRPLPGDLPHPGIKPETLTSPASGGESFATYCLAIPFFLSVFFVFPFRLFRIDHTRLGHIPNTCVKCVYNTKCKTKWYLSCVPEGYVGDDSRL